MPGELDTPDGFLTRAHAREQFLRAIDTHCPQAYVDLIHIRPASNDTARDWTRRWRIEADWLIRLALFGVANMSTGEHCRVLDAILEVIDPEWAEHLSSRGALAPAIECEYSTQLDPLQMDGPNRCARRNRSSWLALRKHGTWPFSKPPRSAL
jgi:hypothetical protein